MKLGITLALASLVTVAGFGALGAPLTLPAFHDGMTAPKTIGVVVARPHRVADRLVSVR
jgi:hypothetical protein